MSRDMTGMVQTVLGPMEPSEMGVTLTHEHILIDLTCYYVQPEEASLRYYHDRPFTIDLLGRASTIWYLNTDNGQLFDEADATSAIRQFMLAGGRTVVDVTNYDLGRDPLALARISRATGLSVVMGAGYYVPVSHPEGMDDISEDDIAEQIVRDVTEGVGETGVRSGIIGEIGCVYPLTANVLKVVRAAARAQVRTGAPILIHPGHGQSAPAEILDILVESGADPANVVLGHLDARIKDRGVLRELASAGTFLEFDTFGIEHGGYGGDPKAIPMPSDAGRMDLLEYLVGLGHREQVVIAHDVCHRWRFVRFGGTGYGHILASVVPRLRARGFGTDDIDAMLERNPARALTLK